MFKIFLHFFLTFWYVTVLAVTMEWQDGRLTWGEFNWSDIPIKTLQVDSEDIWTPHIDLANRIHDRFDERYLDTTLRFDGTIRGIYI